MEIVEIITEIESINKKNKIDLVIFAKTSSSGFFLRISGSTASYLIHNITVLILVIPEKYEHNKFENICYANQLEFEEILF